MVRASVKATYALDWRRCRRSRRWRSAGRSRSPKHCVAPFMPRDCTSAQRPPAPGSARSTPAHPRPQPGKGQGVGARRACRAASRLAEERASMIHLDTSFLIHALVPSTRADNRLRTWLRNGDALAISSIAWAEFLCGSIGSTEVDVVSGMFEEIAPYRRRFGADASPLQPRGPTARNPRRLHDCRRSHPGGRAARDDQPERLRTVRFRITDDLRGIDGSQEHRVLPDESTYAGGLPARGKDSALRNARPCRERHSRKPVGSLDAKADARSLHKAGATISVSQHDEAEAPRRRTHGESREEPWRDDEVLEADPREPHEGLRHEVRYSTL